MVFILQDWLRRSKAAGTHFSSKETELHSPTISPESKLGYFPIGSTPLTPRSTENFGFIPKPFPAHSTLDIEALYTTLDPEALYRI